MKRIGGSLGLIMLATSAPARDDGRYANSPLKEWFESLSAILGHAARTLMDTLSPTSIGNPTTGTIGYASMASG